jgi:hypothetical protein
MYCTRCGNVIDGEAGFCGYCGATTAFTPKPVEPKTAAASQAAHDTLTGVAVGMIRIIAWIGANALVWIVLGFVSPQTPPAFASLFGNPVQSTSQAVAFSAGFTASGLLPAFIALMWKRSHWPLVVLVNACSVAANWYAKNPLAATPRTGWVVLLPLTFWTIAIVLACMPRLGGPKEKPSST